MTTPPQHQQQQRNVQLSLSLRCSPPQSISIQDPYPSSPLQLIATVKQITSPFPDRDITILTKYSCLDTTPTSDAFFLRAMESPQTITTEPGCLASELPLHPVGKNITTIRVSGDPNLLEREKTDGFTFVTIPPVGQGHAEVVFELPPSRLVQRLGNRDESVQDKLARFLRPGYVYRIAPRDLRIRWWAFGSLDDETSLKGKKIARWTLPDELSLERGPGKDETDEVARKLRDLVDLHNVNSLSSRSAVEGEQRPDLREMRSDGWVFGEPEAGLMMATADEDREATFRVVE